MLQHSRKAAAAILLAVLAAGGVLFWCDGRRAAHADAGPDLTELELLIARPDAEPITWYRYGQRLQQAGRLDHAAMAYERFLQLDPYHRDGNLQCALVLAQTGDGDKFFDFMRRLVSSDPRLATAIFVRPEAQGFLSDSRLHALATEAQMQAMD